MKIEFGGGNKKRDGYINVDKFSNSCVDVVHDLNEYPYPFQDESVQKIRAFHVIEHLDDFEKFFDECYRVLGKEGILHIKVPHFTSNAAFLEFHKIPGFWYYCFTERRLFIHTNLQAQYFYGGRFRDVRRRVNFILIYPWNWIMQLLLLIPYVPQLYETTFLKGLFPAKEVEVVLRKI